MKKCNGYMRHWFTKRGETGNHLDKCVRCGEPNPRSMQTEIARLPTIFETKVLRRISRNGMLAGNGMAAISAACRRLERLGYAAHPSTHWWVTDKGEEYLKSIDSKAVT